MKKESRVILTEEQHQLLTAAAERVGMALATYLRTCAMRDAKAMGLHAEQPRPD
jgi:uncharacterized protein (DUF1778 family)